MGLACLFISGRMSQLKSLRKVPVSFYFMFLFAFSLSLSLFLLSLSPLDYTCACMHIHISPCMYVCAYPCASEYLFLSLGISVPLSTVLRTLV